MIGTPQVRPVTAGRAVGGSTTAGEATVRWDELFTDLEAQFDAAEAANLSAELADRTRREAAQLHLADRLGAAVGATVRVVAEGAGPVSGRLAATGPDWLLLEVGAAGERALVPLAAVLAVSGLSRHSLAPGSGGVVAGRLGLGHALRAIARDRAAVAVTLRAGAVLTGTVDRVGADFLELTEAADGDRRATGAGAGAVRIVAFGGLAVVRSR